MSTISPRQVRAVMETVDDFLRKEHLNPLFAQLGPNAYERLKRAVENELQLLIDANS